MKKIFFSLFIISFALNIYAQERGKIRAGIDIGLGLPNEGGGLNGNLDLRYNIKKNINIGILMTGAILFRDANIATGTATISNISSKLLTADYYIHNGNSSFAPFVGGGIGINKIRNIRDTNFSISDFNVFSFNNKIGTMFRGGFEFDRFRMALACYLIPKSLVVDKFNSAIGLSENSYMDISLGFYLGGGRWKK